MNPSDDHDDLDPELLSESGRASAVQDMRDLSVALIDASQAYQAASLDAQEHQTRLWRKAAKAIGAVAAVLAVGLVVVIGLAFANRETSADTNKIVKDLEEQAVDLDRLQADLAEVRDFVRIVRAERDAADSATGDAIAAIARIEAELCGGQCAPPGGG